MDTDGDFLVSWTSTYTQDGSGDGIYARRYNSSGTSLGSEFRVNTTTTNDQTLPSLAMNATGTFVIVWDDGDDTWGQRYNASGVAQGGEFRVNATQFKLQRFADVAMDAAGNFVVTWSSTHQDAAGNKWGIFGQRFTAAGVAVGPEFQANTITSGNQQYSSVAMDSSGDFVIAWAGFGRDGSGWGVFAQQYDPSGN
jgi:hypothetical protein